LRQEKKKTPEKQATTAVQHFSQRFILALYLQVSDLDKRNCKTVRSATEIWIILNTVTKKKL